jgi:hypothetical protein
VANRTKKTPEKYEKFLEALRKTGGNVARACRAEGIARQTAYDWKESDREFAQKWKDAVEEGTDDLEQEARRRALTGLQKTIFYKGEPIGTEREYSDTLMIFLLKGNRPEKYKDRHELTGANGGAIETKQTVDLSKLDKNELLAFKELLAKTNA